MVHSINLVDPQTTIKAVWGGFDVVTTCTAIITTKENTQYHEEKYVVEFSRNQITCEFSGVKCYEREDTTEHTLTREAVQDLVSDKLYDYLG